jgi:hypothetical protein
MLAILTAAALGFLANKYIGIYRTEAGTQNLELHDQELLADAAHFLVALVAVVAFAVNTGRNARAFADSVLLPYLRSFGFQLPELPTLPQVPAASRQLSV